MKIDLSAEARTGDGEPLMLPTGKAATVRDILVTALDAQPTQDDGTGMRRQRPATLAEINERLSIRARFPNRDAKGQDVEISTVEAARLIDLVLAACPVPTAMFMVDLLGGRS